MKINRKREIWGKVNEVDMRKKIVYWCIYFILLIGGMVVSFKVLLLENTTIFLLGLIWIWTGTSLILKQNPYYGQKYSRKYQILLSISAIGLGIVWSIISFISLSNETVPMIFVSLPFVLFDFWIFLHKNDDSNE